MTDESTTILVMQRLNGPRIHDIRKITQQYISKRFKDTKPPSSIIIDSQFAHACSDFLYFGNADNYSKAEKYHQNSEALERAAAVLEDGDVRWFYLLPDTINMLKLMAARYKELSAMFNKNPSHVNFFYCLGWRFEIADLPLPTPAPAVAIFDILMKELPVKARKHLKIKKTKYNATKNSKEIKDAMKAGARRANSMKFINGQ